MTRDTQHVLLALLGGALLRIAADGTYLRYVRPSHRWWLLGAGAMMLVLAVVALVGELRGWQAPDAHEHPVGPGPWLLVLPVLVLTLVIPPPLGADAVGRVGVAALRAGDLYPPLPPGPVELDIGDAVNRVVGDGSGSLAGREVTLTGFVVRHGAETVLARMTITCCAADARPFAVRLVGGDVPDLAPDTWLRVRGSIQPGSATQANRYRPAVTVRDAEVVPAPADPYEY